MNLKEVMTTLKKQGTEQDRKIFKRHGAKNDLFGVSFANLGVLKKKIKIDHDLALEFWNTKNMDSRTLAIMVADPHTMTSKQIDTWVKEIDYYLLADMFSGLVAKTKYVKTKQSKWSKSKKEYTKQTGYAMLCAMLRDPNKLTDSDCKSILKTIENEIHESPNRAKHSMNMVLTAIGIYKPQLTNTAIKTAEKIGKVDVDHGETSCKTPDAVSYIQKAIHRTKK